MKKKALLILFLLLTPIIAWAHPGNTASDGGHYCWTNCDEWGVPYGERHFHNEEKFVSAYLAAIEYVEKSKLNLQTLRLGVSNETFCSQGLVLMEGEKKTAFSNMTFNANLRTALLKEFGETCSQDAKCSLLNKDLEDAIKTFLEYAFYISKLADTNCGTKWSEAALQESIDWAKARPSSTPIPATKSAAISPKNKATKTSSKNSTKKVSKSKKQKYTTKACKFDFRGKCGCDAGWTPFPGECRKYSK